ncbi:MAG TPA: glycerophosphodiester phosphodiesterase family protein, partial [Trichocoleus sp.]
MPNRPLITAHRGSSALAPENTLASLLQAVAEGADFAEVDVQSTADGELVLFHDDDLQRICGDPRPMRELTYAEISQLDVGCWLSPQFAGERVPRLADAIALAQQSNLRLNLELKAARPCPNFAHQVVQQVNALGFAQDCILTSFNRDLLRQVRQQMPHG